MQTPQLHPSTTYDVIICGGGVIGPALAYGIAKAGAKVLILDEGDTAFRAARGNFGLTWFQGKGIGMQAYTDLTRHSITNWPTLAADLEELTSVNVDLQKTGGLEVCLTEQEVIDRQSEIAQLTKQSPTGNYDVEFIDHAQAQDLLGKTKLGPTVLGATYSPLDGHVNPLKLLRGLHTANQYLGGHYLPNQRVTSIAPQSSGFQVSTPTNTFTCQKLVLAAGLGIPDLAPLIGLNIPVYPERGQILVSERVAPMLPLPIMTLRQTAEGSIMMGATNEKAGHDLNTSMAGAHTLAAAAVATIPALAQINIVRTWSALRVLTPDHNPIYDQSADFPGAYVATSHSGVTLAASNVYLSADWVLEDRPPETFSSFSSDRFHAEKP